VSNLYSSRTPGNELSASKQTAISGAVDSAAWGDVESAITGMGETLLRLVDVTSHAADRWDDEDFPWDEYSVPEEAIDEMSDELRLAYVGRLARSLALRYGIGLGDPPDTLIADDSSPAEILRAINDVICLPTSTEAP
jgi:hypothetical protein